MSSVSQGSSATITVPLGRRLRVKAASETEVIIGFQKTRVLAGHDFELNTDRELRGVTIKAVVGDATYTIFYSDVIPFTGALTLAASDNGKLFRCDDGSNVTVTVPNNLPEGFSAGFAMWAAGTVTVAAGSGATKRSSTSALGTQYQWGSLLVVKNADDTSAEFVLGGSFA